LDDYGGSILEVSNGRMRRCSNENTGITIKSPTLMMTRDSKRTALTLFIFSSSYIPLFLRSKPATNYRQPHLSSIAGNTTCIW
jgi:hypothetical protein